MCSCLMVCVRFHARSAVRRTTENRLAHRKKTRGLLLAPASAPTMAAAGPGPTREARP